MIATARANLIANADPFCEARGLMKKLEDELSAPDAMHATHDTIERMVVTEGHKISRRTLSWYDTLGPMPTKFSVSGPFIVPVYEGKAARTLTEENIKEFWRNNPETGKHRGCYVFAIRAGGGITPGYVGKATKTFKQETFQSHKLAKYQRFLADYRKGTPVLFFVVAPKQKGKPNATHIAELERFLIQVALVANPHLLNIQGTKEEEWSITGVLRSGKGKPSEAAQKLAATLKI